MQIVKNTDEKTRERLPLKIKLDNGRSVPVPNQHKFKQSFIREHGCSLVGFYMAVRFRGKKKTMVATYKWAMKNLKHYSKFPLSEIAKGINKVCGKGSATYYKSVTGELLEKKLKEGKLVLFEERKPIHTVALLYDKDSGVLYRFSDGKKYKTSVKKMMAKKCTHKTYKGIVVVKA